MAPDPSPDPARFYDDLAEFYDLIFADWPASMARQGAAIDALIARELPARLERGAAPRILDASCGIGTQSLPLAERGYRVTARDVSASAIARLQREAAARGLAIDAEVADMRSVGSTVTPPFDAAISFDNSVPHLLTDDDIGVAFRELRRVLRPGGLFACSVRDYAVVDRAATSVHPYGEQRRDGVRFQARQEWTWIDRDRYRMDFVVERGEVGGSIEVRRMAAMYYAISTDRLLAVMRDAGFVECRRLDDVIYQPVVLGLRNAEW